MAEGRDGTALSCAEPCLCRGRSRTACREYATGAPLQRTRAESGVGVARPAERRHYGAIPLTGVARGRDGVEALQLADGRELAVDFVIDATGPDRLVATPDGFNGWGRCTALPLPLHRTRCGSAIAGRHISGRRGWLDRALARREGDRACAGRRHSDRTRPPRRANARQCPGSRRSGRAAGPYRPDWFHTGIGRTFAGTDLLPVGGDTALLAAEYNRRVGQRADRMRDFLAAHQIGLASGA